MNAHILLVEGTCGTGKSTLLRGLLTRFILEEQNPGTLLHLTQAHTYFPLVPGDRPVPPDKKRHREHLRKILRMLQWDTEGLTPGKWFTFFCLMDTLHLTHYFRPGTLSWSELSYVDRYLSGLGSLLIFIRAQPETLWENVKFSHNADAVHQYYIREQEEMEKLAHRSSLTTLFLRAEDTPGDLLAKAYAFWMKEKG
jgi:hypothetical protein